MTATKHGIVRVDEAACGRLAAILRRSDVPPDEEERTPDLPRELLANFFLALVAICHQTSPRGLPGLEGIVNGKPRRGWDYLFSRFEDAARLDARLLKPQAWAELTGAETRELLTDQENSTRLTDPEGRAALLRDLGKRMQDHGWTTADEIYEFCGGRVASGDPNLLDTLAAFRAYNDPVRKKSLFFLSLMRNTHTWRYEDDDALGPPVDYHEVRGHLRIGTVTVESGELEQKLRLDSEVTAEEDIAIRQAVYDAIMMISAKCGLSPSRLHYLFWNVFRGVCTRESPHCLAIGRDISLPDRYMRLTLQDDGTRRCPFSSVCASARADDRYYEHVFNTDYY